MRVWWYVRSGCCGCKLCRRGLTVTMPAIANTGIATATWRKRLASKDISRGPRRCHDGGHPRRPAHVVLKQTTYKPVSVGVAEWSTVGIERLPVLACRGLRSVARRAFD